MLKKCPLMNICLTISINMIGVCIIMIVLILYSKYTVAGGQLDNYYCTHP